MNIPEVEESKLWLIPKRVSIHQAWCLIDGLIDRKYDGRTWNASVQNNLGVNLMRWGATRDGKNISPQAIRTLMALVHYLGFTYIDTGTTPHTINITKAGYKFWEDHKCEMVKVKNLVEGSSHLLYQSEDVSFQLQKLQISNPILEKKISDILLFPFRTTLRLLRDLEYLDVEEIAMYVFTMQTEDQYDYVKTKIEYFRKLSMEDRENIVDNYKKTEAGNITLVDAPTTGYYISLCNTSGLTMMTKEHVINRVKKIKGIRIVPEKNDIVKNIIEKEFKGIKAYFFDDNLKLWIDYYGYPDRKYTPVLSHITNKIQDTLYVEIVDKNGEKMGDEVIERDMTYTFPAFPHEKYILKSYSFSQNTKLKDITLTSDENGIKFDITSNEKKQSGELPDILTLSNEIKNHIESNTFSESMLQHLLILKKLTGIDKLKDQSLRGAHLEHMFYLLLSELKKQNVIEDVIWNGRLGKYNLPVPSPGGKNGQSDVIFFANNKCFVLELTTMKSKSSQESAEASSVPDHIRLYMDSHPHQDVYGIYSPPIKHDRVENMMQATAKLSHVRLKTIVIKDLLELLVEKNIKGIESLYE